MPDPARDVVYKICAQHSWDEAKQRGSVSPSADDVRDGFIHLSARHQVPGTLLRHFAGQSALVLLRVEVARLPSGALRWERSRGGEEFPHLYAELPAASVSASTVLAWDGARHALPESY